MAVGVRDGVQLFYEDVGGGSPPLLFVHGIMCDHRFWGPQVEYFRSRHRTVAVDLRGHGQSDAPQQDYTMALFADDLAWLCRTIALTKPVVIGHSMGGVAALELAARHPDLPAAIAILDSPIMPPPSVLTGVSSFSAALCGADWRNAQQALATACFSPDSDAAVKAWVLERMGGPQHVVASAFERLFTCDTGAAAAACRVPMLYVSAATTPADVDRLRTLCPQLITGQTVGAGHFHQLEVPEQINTMIERFLRIGV